MQRRTPPWPQALHGLLMQESSLLSPQPPIHAGAATFSPASHAPLCSAPHRCRQPHRCWWESYPGAWVGGWVGGDGRSAVLVGASAGDGTTGCAGGKHVPGAPVGAKPPKAAGQPDGFRPTKHNKPSRSGHHRSNAHQGPQAPAAAPRPEHLQAGGGGPLSHGLQAARQKRVDGE